MTRRGFVAACGAVAGLVLGVATLSATASQLEYLTFSGPVGLPGVTLGAGTYSFEVLDTMSSAHVVSVRDRATRKPVFLGMTQRIERPASSRNAQAVVLGESPRGVPAPIIAWYPEGATIGHQFLYPRQ